MTGNWRLAILAFWRTPPVGRADAAPYLPLMRHLAGAAVGIDGQVMERLFGLEMLLEAQELGLVREGFMGTDSEYWRLTRVGRRALAED